MSQPHFGQSVRMRLTLPKVGTWSPPGLPQLWSSTRKGKTHRFEVLFIPLERSWSVDVQMASHEPFGHLQPKLWAKEGSGVKLAVWLPTTKSRESTQFWCLQKEYDMALQSSQRELQDCFRLHPNSRSEQEVMDAQSPRNPTQDSFGTLLGSPGKKCHSDVASAE